MKTKTPTAGQLLATPNIVALCKLLRTLPFYHLSLSSLELFHSNFWAWMIELFGTQALVIFDSKALLDKIELVSREPSIKNPNGKQRRYLDLRVIGSKEERPHTIIIENKIKSLVSTKQLDEICDWSHDQERTTFLVVSLFTHDAIPSTWTAISYRSLANGVAGLCNKTMDERLKMVISEYLALIDTLASIAEELEPKQSNQFDFFLSDDDSTLSKQLDDAKLFSAYSKYRLSGLSNYVFVKNKDWLTTAGYEPTFNTGESEGNVFFEHGYSSKSRDAFAEFVIPMLNGKIRIGIQIARDSYMYFVGSSRDNAEKIANELDDAGLWFDQGQRSRKKKNAFRIFGEDFRYETVRIPAGTEYDQIAKEIGEGLKHGLELREDIEKVLSPFFK